MLFLIISKPKENEDDPKVVEARLRQKNWIEKLQKERKISGFYHLKKGGRVAILRTNFEGDLDSFLNKWKEYVNEDFDIYPLKDPKKAEMDMAKKLFS